MPPDKSTVILVAGGVGIAPLLGMLEEAAAQHDTRQFCLLYAARKQTALVYLDRLRELKSQLDLSIICLVDEDPRDEGCAAGPLRSSHVHELLSGRRPSEVVALICGPPRMMEVAADALLEAGVPRTSVLYERFDYGAGKGPARPSATKTRLAFVPRDHRRYNGLQSSLARLTLAPFQNPAVTSSANSSSSAW